MKKEIAGKEKQISQISIKAFAKINLTLDVLDLLPNGYHQVEMVMQQIELHDVVTISIKSWTPLRISEPDQNRTCQSEPNQNRTCQSESDQNRTCQSIPDQEEGGTITIRSSSQNIPLDSRNIAYKAAEMLLKRREKKNGEKLEKVEVDIDIEKNIPVEAGLAGGSGNGAAALLGLNKLLQLKLELDDLLEMGALLGADVPFAILGQIKGNASLAESFSVTKSKKKEGTYAALAQGIGTELTEVTPCIASVLLSKPKEGVSTKEVYRAIDNEKIIVRPNTTDMILALKNKDLKGIERNMVNVLENYTLKRYDNVVYTKNKMEKHIPKSKAMMTGSGPTVFAIGENEEFLKKAYDELKMINKETILTTTLF